jgi:hypothetical protein
MAGGIPALRRSRSVSSSRIITQSTLITRKVESRCTGKHAVIVEPAAVV